MKLERREPKRGTISMLPLINAMLIVLVFFIAFGTLKEMETEEGIDIPVASQSREWRKTVDQLILNVKGPGKFTVNKEPFTIATLAPFLGGLTEQNPNIVVVVRAKKDMDYGEVRKILNCCTNSGVWNIILATLETAPTSGGSLPDE